MKTETTVHGNGSPRLFGIIGFILAILSLLLSLVPCAGYYAFIPGLLSFVFCMIATIAVRKKGEPAGLFIAGMIVGLLAVLVAFVQYFVFKDAIKGVNKFHEEMDEVIIEEILKPDKDSLSSKHDTVKTSTDTLNR